MFVHVCCQLFSSFHVNECLFFFRNDFGCFPLHGPYSEVFCQKPSILSEDTLQSAERRESRKEENVKYMLKECIYYTFF